MVLSRDTVVSALYDAGLDESALYERYSGRGMYGNTCFGITGSAADAAKFLIAIGAAVCADEAYELADRMRTDSLGTDIITYFQGARIATDGVAA